MALTDRPAASTAIEPRFPCFDGLRALAALAVFMTHTSFAGGANAPNLFGIFFARMDGGVAVFFVLSGVLIYRPFARAHLLETPTPAIRGYLWRRAIRIYPAYWLAMTVVVFVFGATEIPNLRSFVLDYSLLHIYSPHQQDAFGPLLQSWTLSTELAFYVFVPLWALLLRRVARGDVRSRLRAQLVGVLVLIGVSALWKAFVLGAGFGEARIGQLKMWLPWWIDLFALGMALGVLSLAVTHLGDRPPLRLDGRLRAGALLARRARRALVGGGRRRARPHDTVDRPPPAVGPALPLRRGRGAARAARGVRTAGSRHEPHPGLPPDARAMVYLGTISYGIYLWHEGWIDRYLQWTGVPAFATYTSDVPFRWHTNSVISIPWFTFVLAVLALTVASATISWYACERPILRFKHRFDG